MDAKAVINLRGTDCSPEAEEAFNKWYSEVHIPMLIESGEIKGIKRYKRISEDDKYPKYLVVYEFEDREAFERYEASPQLAAAVQDVKDRWRDGGYEPRWRAQYELVESWKKDT